MQARYWNQKSRKICQTHVCAHTKQSYTGIKTKQCCFHAVKQSRTVEDLNWTLYCWTRQFFFSHCNWRFVYNFLYFEPKKTKPFSKLHDYQFLNKLLILRSLFLEVFKTLLISHSSDLLYLCCENLSARCWIFFFFNGKSLFISCCGWEYFSHW